MLVLMVTGQLFLMQLNNREKKSNALSILLHGDGFSFCTPTHHHLYTFEKDNLTEKSLRSWIDYHQLKELNPTLIHFENEAVTVPEELFSEDNLVSYLTSSQKISEEEEQSFDPVKKTKQKVVYSISKEKKNLLKAIFPKASSSHFVSSLLPDLATFSEGRVKKNLFIHLRNGYFDLFLYQGSQLLIQNSFKQVNADEFLYYLFYVTEQFYLNPDQFDLYFLGEYDKYADYYTGVSIFHNAITFLDSKQAQRDPAHPIPYFHHYVSE